MENTVDITKGIKQVVLETAVSKAGKPYTMIKIQTIDKDISLEYFLDRKDAKLLHFLKIQ